MPVKILVVAIIATSVTVIQIMTIYGDRYNANGKNRISTKISDNPTDYNRNNNDNDDGQYNSNNKKLITAMSIISIVVLLV